MPLCLGLKPEVNFWNIILLLITIHDQKPIVRKLASMSTDVVQPTSPEQKGERLREWAGYIGCSLNNDSGYKSWYKRSLCPNISN